MRRKETMTPAPLMVKRAMVAGVLRAGVDGGSGEGEGEGEGFCGVGDAVVAGVVVP